jgi:hypothetical protein
VTGQTCSRGSPGSPPRGRLVVMSAQTRASNTGHL